VEGARIVERGAVQILDRTDPRTPLGQNVIGVFRDHEALEPAIGRREDALAQFLLHHVALAVENFLVDHRLEHAFAVRPQHGFEIGCRNGLVIIGAIGPGRSVARAADIGGEAVYLVVEHVLGLAAENVFEEVGEAAAAFGIMLRSDFVPERGGDLPGAVVRQRDDAQTVVERPFGEGDFRRGQRCFLRQHRCRCTGGERDGGGACGKDGTIHDWKTPSPLVHGHGP
jgi:hypothetical protein